jgi:hypothetical protein
MRRKDVLDNIEGSRLKKQFLEAFLLQSAFIESLLKKLIDDDFFSSVTFKVMGDEFKKGNFLEPKQISFIKERLLRQNLYEIIEYLGKIEVIDSELKRKLHKYRESRNDVLHDLVGKMSRDEFEAELEGLVSEGQIILENKAMINASEALQRSEELREIVDSGDTEKLEEYFKKI